MPARNTVKTYLPNSFYHLYNRGTDKRLIFLDHQDFLTLLSYFRLYLTPRKKLRRQIKGFKLTHKPTQINSLIKALNNNFANKIQLHAYILMPNHYHLLLKQTNSYDMPAFIQTIFTCYAYYFNARHKRSGRLFQSIYRAKLIKTDRYFAHLARYIHLNSSKLQAKNYPKYRSWQSWADYPYSSCQYYLSESKQCSWLTKGFLQSYFSSTEEHKSFLKNYDPTQLEAIKDNILE
jgi:putative transposase